MMRKGQTLYVILSDDDGKPTIEQYIIRTIRGGKITAIWKLPLTWGKRSSKTGNYGWLDPIPAWCRQTWREGTKPFNLYTTKLQAIRAALKDYEPDDFLTIEAYNRCIAAIKRMRP